MRAKDLLETRARCSRQQGGAGCTLVLPVIGTVACGTAGAVAGGVFGGMVGAATFC